MYIIPTNVAHTFNKTMFSSKHKLVEILNKCNSINSFKQIHAQLITSNSHFDELLLTKSAQFFIKHINSINYACDFFTQFDPTLNSFPYNTLISGYASSNKPNYTLLVYNKIVFKPDMYTFPVLLKACSRFMGVEEGKQIHGLIVKMGLIGDLYVGNSLVHFYSVCGHCISAGKVFDEMGVRDVVSWTGLISGFVKAAKFDEAVRWFVKMDVKPNVATFVSVLVACGKLGFVSLAKGIHALIRKVGLFDLVVGNAIVDMYVKCGILDEARWVFDEIVEKDVVSWTSMISGLVRAKRAKEALELFDDMRLLGVEPDKVILTSVLAACASIGGLDYGRWVHECIERMRIRWDIHIGTAMIDMYAKCGSIEMALQTFDKMSKRNVYTWNTMISGSAMHGFGKKSLEYFEHMVKAGVRPNEVTFLAILTACCHSGLVEEGRKNFNLMTSHKHNLSPKLEHYGCMVDLLCKAGLIDEALELIRSMPEPPDVLIWGAVLSTCKASRNYELYNDILDRLIKLETQDSGVFVLLSNIYASNRRWDDVKRIRRLMKNRGVKKEPGSSVVEVEGKAHEFLVGDTAHPLYKDIHMLLDILASQACFEGQRLDP